MWSGSGLFGWSVVPHASGCAQSGQLICPAAWARWRTRLRHFLWLVVPVRDAVMVVLFHVLGLVSVVIVPSEGLVPLHVCCQVSSVGLRGWYQKSGWSALTF